MTDLFNRQILLRVDNLEIRSLDVQFKVALEDQNLGKAEIMIFNLNEAHRKQIESQDALEVSLAVKYEDQTEYGILFKGDIREAYSEKKAPDWVTVLRTGDGDGAPQKRANESFSKGVSIETMWKKLVSLFEEAGIGAGNAIKAFQEGEFKDGITQLFNGGILQGDILKEARRLCLGAGLDVTIQDKELVVTKIGQPLAASAVLLSNTTGLIGSPKRGAKGEMKVRSLLIAGLRPKRKVQIKSRLVDGLYVIKKAQYKGDTAGNDWYADLDCAEITTT